MNSPEPETASNERRIASMVIRVLVALIPVIPILIVAGQRQDDPPHEDEIYWIGSAYYYHLAISGDIGNPDWQLLPARENPAQGKYVIGAVLHAFGSKIESLNALGSFYLMFVPIEGSWGAGEAYRKREAVAQRVDPQVAEAVLFRQAVPINPNDLRIVRRLMVVLAMLTAIGIGLIGQQCQATVAGLLSALLWSVHPIVQPAYNLAMIDMVALCFSVWGVVGLIALTRRQLNPDVQASFRDGAIAVATALLITMACGSKMNSLVVAALAVLLIGYYLGHRLRSRTWSWTALAVIIGATAVSTVAFVATNPTLYPNVAEGVAALSEEHRLTADIQETMFGGGRLQTISERIVALSNLVCRGPFTLGIVLAAAIWQMVKCWRERQPFLVVALWWWIALVLLVAWLPFSWDRYALPLVTPTLLIVTKAAVDLVVGVAHWISNPPQQEASA